MSRPWNPGQEPDSFNLRWHSVANPATSSLDIMSSPDPLNDPATPTVPEHIPSSATRRVTRSQRSQRFVSLGSPQKPSYMDEENIDPGFALGAPVDSDTPEPDDDRPSSAGSRATSRQLFPSSSRPPSRQQPRATTTVVPLNDSIEDDPIAADDAPITPRRRGRLRSSNGTPIPGTKRRAGTPIRKTPRRTRETPSETSEQGSQATPTPKRRARAQREVQATPTPTPEPQPQPQPQTQREATPQNREASVSEADSQATPTPRRSARRTPKRTAAPSSDLGLDSERDLGSIRRSTRRRRQALAPEDLVELAESAVITDEVPASDDGLDLVNTAADPPSVRSTRAQNTREASEPASDIWMATLSNEATPRPSTRSSARNRTQTSSVTPRRSARATKSPYKEPLPAPSPTPVVVEEPDHDPEPEPQPEYEEEQQSQSYDGGYGFLAPAESDVSSADDFSEAPVATRDMDTIAQGEDFSMIFMDSIPAMNASVNQSANPATYSDLGDETNMIINNTLESLRQDADEEDEELPDLVDHPSPESEEEAEVPTPTSQEKRQSNAAVPQPSSSPSRRSSVRQSPARAASSQPSTAKPSPIKQLTGQSPQLSYSPRKNASPSPLRQRLLKSRATGGDNSPIVSPNRRRSTLGPGDQSLANAPSNDESLAYDDSFSEIPQDILAAATPRRPGATFVEEQEEEDQEEDEIAMDELVYDAERSQAQPVMEQFENDVAESIEEDGQLDAEEDPQDDEEPEVEDDLQDELAQDMVDAEADIAGMQDELEEEQESDIAEQELQEADQYEMDEAEDEEVQDEDAEDAEDQLASNASAGRPEASRLPTPPDDVPLPTPAPAPAPALATAPSSSRGPSSLQRPRFQSNITSPLQSMNIANSVPDYEMAEPTPMSQQRQSASAERSASSITPVNQISSPAREPRSLSQEQLHEKGSRPLLSPIVRAGRMLQSVTSDPPSPDDRDRQLRSPFRSSTSKDSARGSKDGFTGHWMSKSPTRAIGLNEQLYAQRESPKRISPGNRFTSAAAQDTPRANTSAPSLRVTSPAPAQQTPAGAGAGAPSSTRLSPSSDGVMSWIMREGPISPKLRGDNSLREAYAAAGSNRGVTPQPAIALNDDEDVSDSAESESEVHEAVEAVTAAPMRADDETDIWELEAQRAPATPRSTRQQPFGKRTTPGTARRRAAIPKAWATQQDDAATPRAAVPVSTTPAAQSTVDYPNLPDLPEPEPQAEEAEGYSMLEKRRAAEEAAKGESSAVKNSRFDLSAFFSSPAAIPGMLAEKFFPGKTQADAAKAKPSAALPTTSMFPADDATPVRPNPPSAKRRRQVGFGNNTREESPDSPEEPTLPVISQKQNFTPRPRQTSQTFYQPNSAAAQSTAATPPRMQLSHADIRRWQQEMSSASEDSPDFVRPLLRPLPPKNASPSKSILRSPLKPRTPGRVVEFTSSVLSPMEQAKARHERRTSNASASSGFNSLIQQHQQQHDDHELQQDAPEQLEQTYNKENHDSDISMSDAPPVQRKTVPVPVSQTTWTRQHWLFLDWLIRQRRLSPFEVEYDRSADKYLGKTVRSHGEAMMLERWHLDCVDAFKAEVGGWDEGALVKRLFALILGEEKRGSGDNGQPALLFH